MKSRVMYVVWKFQKLVAIFKSKNTHIKYNWLWKYTTSGVHYKRLCTVIVRTKT